MTQEAQLSDAEEKRFGLKYSVYRWVLCGTVMLVLIPMAGTMTSFGAIKNAVNTTRECRPKEGKFMTVEATVNTNCSEEDMIEIEDWARTGYENIPGSVLSLVGSLVFGFTVGSSMITSPLIQRFGYRKMALTGVTTGILALLATMMTTSFYWWFVTYSVAFGISNNLLYNTGMQMCNAFFPTDYNTAATVLASFGISLGTMIMNPLSVYLTDTFGWRYRFLACAVILAVLGYPMCFIWGQPMSAEKYKAFKGEKDKEEDKDLVEKADLETNVKMINPADTMNLWTSVVFWAWLFGTTFWSLDFVIPLDFAIGFMVSGGISRPAAGSVMTALGISELISRALCAITGEQKVISKPSIYIISSAVGAGACVLPIIAWNSKGDGDLSITIMFVYAIVVGFCAGVLNCLIMACTVDIFGQKRTVEVWNYVNLMLGIGFVGGPPIGAWFTSTVVNGQLVYVFYLAIAFFVLCSLTMAPIPFLMGKLQPRPATDAELSELNNNNNNNNNREDAELIQEKTSIE